MKVVLAISVALILAGCSGDTPPARRAASSDSASAQESDYTQLLALWRSYRIERSQVSDAEDYTRGFQRGHTGPPGLVDGSADFNLGHSDGMQAKMGILPERPDAGNGE